MSPRKGRLESLGGGIKKLKVKSEKLKISEKNMIKKLKKLITEILILALIGLMVGLNFWIPEVEAATQATSSASVTNALPVASSVCVSDDGTGCTDTAINLTEATTKTVTVTFTVTDNNGCEDINSHATEDTRAVFYRTNVTEGAACTAGNNDCYHIASSACTLSGCTTGGADLDAAFSCTVAVQFYADATDAGTYVATDWTATAQPYDNAGTVGTTAADTIEMNTLTALNVTTTIAYGALALGANTGTTDQTTVVTNTGNNDPIDIQLDGYGAIDGDGYSMTCTIGTIIIGNERYSLTAATDWSTKTLLTDTAANVSTFNLAKGASSTKNVYWGFGMPSTGVGGSCTGKVNFTAITNI